MYGIIFKKDYDPTKCIPIMNEDETTMATFDTEQEALSFAETHILANCSDWIIIDLVDTL